MLILLTLGSDIEDDHCDYICDGSFFRNGYDCVLGDKSKWF